MARTLPATQLRSRPRVGEGAGKRRASAAPPSGRIHPRSAAPGSVDSTVVPACADKPHLWFPGNRRVSRVDMERVAAVCRQCPIRRHCAELALGIEDDVVGVWAGVLVPATPRAGRQQALDRLRDIGAGLGDRPRVAACEDDRDVEKQQEDR
ncbi:hypothetical protein GCM10011489_36780 [Gordonia jinhuaensis]|uniref:4Fe-4S Wbl-type domain-containing protein n=1 Tax=Gordonia jinhuaensis TaxID=1517702 RepID=A0A916X014_9ACTN|nr:hypothetical protein GCM10011489_36780 [Gordonia jinhuaensis]